MWKKSLMLVVFVLVSTFVLNARDYMFKHIESKDGLSNSQVNKIFKDSRGFMWFGTASGLNRYDGYHFNVYRNSLNDINTLPDSYIQDIQEAASGLLWVLTGDGYALYDPQTDMFDRDIRRHVFEFGLDTEPTSVYIDNQKNYWFYVEDRGCFWYNAAQKILYPFLQSDKVTDLPPGKIAYITECKEGVLFVYDTGLLVCVNGDMRRVAWMNDFIPVSLDKKAKTFSAFVDKKENVWVYGNAGLWIFNKEQGKWMTSLEVLAKQWEVPFLPAMNDAIVGVTQDESGVLWIATQKNGLLIANPQTKTFSWIKSDLTDRRSIQDNLLSTLYADNEKGIVWVGMSKSGIAYYSASTFKFKVDAEYNVTAIASSAQGDYWLGTNGSGVINYDPVTKQSRALPQVANKTNDITTALFMGGDGRLWVGTNEGTLYCTLGTKTTTYQIVSGDMEPIPVTFSITSILEDERGNIWLGTLGGGVQCLDVKTGRLTVFNQDKNKLASDRVTSLFLSKNKELIIGTSKGISIMDMARNKVSTYTGCKVGNRPFSNLYINQVIEDKRGLLWLATHDGLNVYDIKNDHLDILNVAEGLSNGVIYGIAEGSGQTVWITTAGGISNVIVEQDKPESDYSFRIYNYTQMDGLQGSEFNPRSIWIKKDGVLAVGGLRGLNVFNPNTIVYNKKSPKVLFSGLRLFGEDVSVGKSYRGQVVLKGTIGQEPRLVLDKSLSIFTILFGSDDYSMPEKTRFKYKLEGFYDEWMMCDPSQHNLTFTNLDPGKYVLKVKALNSDGYSSEETGQLVIEIQGSFWTSVWAYLIYIVVMAVGLWVFVKIWIKRERKRVFREIQTKNTAEVSSVQTTSELKEDVPSGVPAIERVVKKTEELPLVMIVDENPEFSAYLSDGLQSDYQIKTARDFSEAWELILQLKPSIVLCSVAKDNELGGVELCCRLKADERTLSVPVILLPTQSTEELESLGIEVCLPKPFTIDRLRKHVSALLAGEELPEAEASNLEIIASATTGDEILVNNMIRYIEENISRADLSVEEMAREMGMSRAHLYKKLVAISKKTPIEFIRSVRLKHAAELLKDGRYNVSEVAYQVGFNNPKYFSKYFSEEYGILPSLYQERELKR